jgi:hypothetical protein
MLQRAGLRVVEGGTSQLNGNKRRKVDRVHPSFALLFSHYIGDPFVALFCKLALGSFTRKPLKLY